VSSILQENFFVVPTWGWIVLGWPSCWWRLPDLLLPRLKAGRGRA
jgi:hypothetical protein